MNIADSPAVRPPGSRAGTGRRTGDLPQLAGVRFETPVDAGVCVPVESPTGRG